MLILIDNNQSIIIRYSQRYYIGYSGPIFIIIILLILQNLLRFISFIW